MSNSRALAKAELNGFSGIDVSSPVSDKYRADDIVNFRILPDGSLIKRNGYRPLVRLPMEVRAVWTGYLGGEFIGYAVAGDSVYKLDFSNGSYTHLGYIYTSEGRVSIFYYIGHIYVIDGEEIYDVKENGIVAAEGYAPLFGKDWDTSYAGEINEPLNLLTPHARISYLVGDNPSIFLATVYSVRSIEAIYVNGELIDASEYKIDDNFKTINISGLQSGDRVLVYLTFVSSLTDRSELVANTEAMVFGGISNSRVFMWGGEDKNIMFSSGYVSNENLRESERIYSDKGALYFPSGYDFSVGDGRYAITAVNRHYDRLLIFTDGDTWMADSGACGIEEFPVMRINSDTGCSSVTGSAKCGNDPISVGRGRIMRWTSNTDELEDCNSYSISDGISPLLPRDFFENALVYEDSFNREILFAVRGDEKGTVFVYGISNGKWYRYEGIGAETFFSGPDSIGFSSGETLYMFDASLDEDIVSSGERYPIVSEYSLSQMDFGMPERKKRVMEVNIEADLQDENLELTFESDGGILTSRMVSGRASDFVTVYSERMNTDRFGSVRLRLKSDSSVSQRIYRLTVSAKP